MISHMCLTQRLFCKLGELTSPREGAHVLITEDRKFYRRYGLKDIKKNGTKKEPARHQKEALNCLFKWYDTHPTPYSGKILVLPTGGGKTFVAIRFLCNKALSDGYKVLWLAHTHHLLEQAFYDFENHLGEITSNQSSLSVRVVSGTKGHFHVHAIDPSDNVVIATLQTITKAYKGRHPALEAFLKAAEGKLFVVFDEAHHAPAPSYRNLIRDLRDRYPKMYLLGLTATPFYSDEKLQGWLLDLFPQTFPSIVTPKDLMAQGILAEPVIEQYETGINPDFDENEYKKWVGTSGDLPEDIITELAKNEDRNLKIAKHYANNRKKYGKTIIFADRWFQCEAISEFLKKHEIRTGTIYTHIDADPGSADARNKRKADENNEVLEKFRKNELDVVLNVRMLTEGTDIPDVNTVFITRQTTSKILLTQMVGRALRGPKFGGTEKANLIFFIDNWEKLINWAEYEPLIPGIAGPDPEYGKRPPLRYISIELVRKLAAQMYRSINANPEKYKSLLPLGWYRVEYAAGHADSEEIELLQRLIMVFDNEADNYKKLIDYLLHPCPSDFEDESIQFEQAKEIIEPWRETFFPQVDEHFGSNLLQDIFSIARHIAQREEPPKFFKFEERDLHDLDKIAEDLIEENLGQREENERVRLEYDKDDRYWKVFYPKFDDFKHHYNGCKERILNPPKYTSIVIIDKEEPGDEEPPEDVKAKVKERDGWKCLCCGHRRRLQVDHIKPKNDGGLHLLDNLQTLCGECNRQKNESAIDFRESKTHLTTKPGSLPDKIKFPRDVGDTEAWKRYLRQRINFFYQCDAVQDIKIGQRGDAFHHWRVYLNASNDPKWIEPYLKEMLDDIRSARGTKRKNGPDEIIIISAPDSA